MTDPALEAVDLTRRYQLEGVSVEALRGVTLRIDQGEFAAIIGPSGSGKSTLMHLLGCLDRPSSGQLRVNGVEMSGLSDTELAELRNRTIGFVFQSFHLLARTSALENVALPLVYRGMGKAERRERARAALEAVGLAHRLDHRPSQMSGGEQQRVAIARALVGEPTVLLADEPTGNLDTRNGAEVMAMLDRLNSDSGVAIVLVTHEPEIAAHARRQIHVRDGLIELDTTTPSPPHHPKRAHSEVARSEGGGSEVGRSELGRSEVAHSEGGQPDVDHPEHAHPDVDHPEHAHPDVDHPEHAHPGVGHPGVGHPERAHSEGGASSGTGASETGDRSREEGR
ncbi:ABC transporter ATP-binding protein [Nonomuraea endophytica]|uniref:ABC transporter ATP-binding protein n=1 Tax=Nonomuraea endophytica TaxID=714136 RepID=UPI0037C9033B